jgi:hypothetical protein
MADEFFLLLFPNQITAERVFPNNPTMYQIGDMILSTSKIPGAICCKVSMYRGAGDSFTFSVTQPFIREY